MIDLTSDQLQDIIHTILKKEEGLNELMEMMLNGLMRLERSHWMNQQSDDRNKANGYRPGQAAGYGRKLSLQIPRDRLGAFQPVIWAMLRDQNEEVRRLCFELYGKGLTTRQVGQITEKIYGKAYSSSAISQFNQQLAEELHAWRTRPLQANYPVILIDAIYAKIRRDHVSSEAFYVVLGLTGDMQREVLAIENIPSESSEGWSRLFASLKERGLQGTKLVLADALPGLDQAIHKAFPDARHQKCVTHLKRGILTRVRATDKQAVAEDLRQVFLTGQKKYTRQQAKENFTAFAQKWGKTYRFISKLADQPSMEYYFTYLDFDWRIQSMIYTTNWIERLNKSFRRSLKIRNALPSSEAALLLLAKVAVDTEDSVYQYPIYNFKFDQTLFPNAS
ncbi:MAG: IS256 family transposase [Balneolaceae bacterium]